MFGTKGLFGTVQVLPYKLAYPEDTSTAPNLQNQGPQGYFTNSSSTIGTATASRRGSNASQANPAPTPTFSQRRASLSTPGNTASFSGFNRGTGASNSNLNTTTGGRGLGSPFGTPSYDSFELMGGAGKRRRKTGKSKSRRKSKKRG